MVSSSDTGVSDTVDPMAVVSDDEIPSEGDVYTSDTTMVDVPLDVVSDDDIDLFDEGPPEDDYEGGALIDADVVLPIAEAPVEELPAGSPVPDSLESVASASLHDQGVQHHSPDADPDLAMSAAPAPALAPPIVDLPVVAPPVVDDPVVDVPLPDPVPALVDRAPFAAHIDPRYADTCNGWIEDDDDYPPFVLPVTPPVAPVSAPTNIPLFPPHTTDVHRTDFPITFLQDIPPPHPGEGSSRQPPVSVPPMLPSSFPFMPKFPHVVPPTAPSFIPSSEPFLWTTPPVMPLSDPYHPFHMGYTTEDILASLQLQQDALSRRIQELERAPRLSCHCQTPFVAPHTPRLLSPDSDVRFLTSEQQIAYFLRVCRALEEDWLHMHLLRFSRFPPPPPSPSA
ncbi:leucine-rich repeat extensin-like protein 5 [Helianthus annuus]|uniref:leucine-rich repeat extensin-like protein 5 n=1 Tax=Helianthus annuus TaxID=4232 RepID=UPI000B903F73|nr:leucine-rich repeat extensin-like protein 5 [Helianthus annuus]